MEILKKLLDLYKKNKMTKYGFWGLVVVAAILLGIETELIQKVLESLGIL